MIRKITDLPVNPDRAVLDNLLCQYTFVNEEYPRRVIICSE